MAERIRLVDGVLSFHDSSTDFSRVVVELWRTVDVPSGGGTEPRGQLLGHAWVDGTGTFVLPLVDDGTSLDGILQSRSGGKDALTFVVLQGSHVHGTVTPTWRTDSEPYTVEITATKTSFSAPDPDAKALQGTLTRPNGFGLKGLDVDVVKLGVEGETVVTHTGGGAKPATDGNGTFSFPHGLAEKSDLVLRFVKSGTSELVVASQVRYGVEDHDRLYLALEWDKQEAALDTPTEFEVLHGTLDSDLSAPEVDLDNYTGESIAYVAERYTLDPEQIARYIAARMLWDRASDAGAGSPLSVEVFYGLLCEGETPNLPTLAEIDEERLSELLASAIERGCITRTADDDVSGIVAELDKVVDDEIIPSITAGSPSVTVQTTVLTDLFALSGPAPSGGWTNAHLSSLVGAVRTSTAAPSVFWSNWKTNNSFSDADLRMALRRLQYAKFFLRHVGAVEQLFTSHGSSLDEPSDIVDLTSAQIETVISTAITSTSDFPDGVKGADLAAMVDNFRDIVLANVEEAFPSKFFVAELARDTWSGTPFDSEQGDAKDFFDFSKNGANAAFDFSTTNIADYFDGSPGLTDVGDAAALEAFLKSVQRIYRVTTTAGRYAVAKALLSAGVTSAWEIQRKGMRRFVSEHGTAVGGAATARSVFGRAQQQVAAALHTFSTLDAGFEGPDLPVLPNFRKGFKDAVFDSNKIPSYDDFFGSNSFCEPDHAESVLGPPAYLVDLLYFLKDIEAPNAGVGGTADDHAYTLLTDSDRRPDLGEVALSKANTYTTLPYIDLVNELLEVRVAGAGSVPSETRGSSAERRATPDRSDGGYYTTAFLPAYEALREAAYPLTLPWDLPTEELRTFLDHLGVGQHDLKHALRATAATNRWQTVGVLQDQLGLMPNQWACIDAASGQLTIETATVPDEVRLGFASGSTTWLSDLTDATTFLEKLGVEQGELYALSHARMTPVQVKTGADPCDFSQHTVEGSGTAGALVATDLLQAQSLVRLSRLLGWSIADVDRVLYDMGAIVGSPSTTLLTTGTDSDLALLHALCDLGDLKPLEALTLWYDIDAHDGRLATLPDDASLLTRAFLPESLTDANVRDGFKLSWSGIPLMPEIDAPGTDRYTLGDFSTTSSPNTLSYPHQPAVNTAVMAGLGLDREQYQLLLEGLSLAGAGLDMDNLSRLYGATRLAKACGLGVSDWLRLNSLISTSLGLDPFDGAFKHQALSYVEAAHRFVSGPATLDDLEWLLMHDTEAGRRLGLTEAGLLDELRRLWERLRSEQDEDATTLRERRRETLASELAAVVGQSSEAARALVDGLDDGGTPLSDFFTDTAAGGFLDSAVTDPDPALAVTATTPTDALTNWTRLRKAAHVAQLLALTDDEVAVMVGRYAEPAGSTTYPDFAGTFSLLDVGSLPTAATSAPAYQDWDRTVRFFGLRAALRQPAYSFAELIALTEAADNAADVSVFTGPLKVVMEWGDDNFSAFTGSGHANLSTTNWQSPAVWEQVFEAMAVAGRTGASMSELLELSGATVDQDLANKARNIARSRYEPAAWNAVVTPLQDQLRELQRDALVSYLVGDPAGSIDSVTDLYDDLLVDPLMRADQLTSRLVQATGSVQLFVHRCLLGLEEVSLSHAAQERWSWMKQYRVWEAARKVFLWPENWIEPDLRIHRTPLFEELQSVLAQGELTTERAREAYLAYLQGLNDVASVRVVAMVVQQAQDDDGDFDQVHLFGRTSGAAGRWVWRTWENRARWTAWRDVPLDIQSNHLLPVVHHGRLLVAWPVFEEVVEAHETGRVDDEGEPILREHHFSAVRMSYSEYRETGWATPVVSTERVPLYARNRGSNMYVSPDDIFFRTAFPEEDYVVREGTLVVTAWTLDESLPVAGAGGSQAVYLGAMTLDDCTGEFKWVWPAEIWGEEGEVYGPHNPLQKDAPGGFPAGTQPHAQQWLGTRALRLPTDPDRNPAQQRRLLRQLGRDFEVTTPVDRWDFDIDEAPCVFADGERSYLIDVHRVVRRGDPSGTDLDPKSVFDLPRRTETFEPTLRQVALQEAPATVSLYEPPAVEAGASKSAGGGAFSRRKLANRARLPGAGSRTMQVSRSFGERETIRRTREIPVQDVGQSRVIPRAARVLAQIKVAGAAAVPAANLMMGEREFRFEPLHHPYVCLFMEQVRRHGVSGLLNPDPDGVNGALLRQAVSDSSVFNSTYNPSDKVATPYPVESVDFDMDSAFGNYNWELFFHGPMFIADQLRQEQKFKEAIDWFHYVFNPIGLNDNYSSGGSSTSWSRARDAWRIKPFSEGLSTQFGRMVKLFAANTADEPDADMERLLNQLRSWRDNPFDPHAIAENRVIAYQKWVVMRYLDTLIEWGDFLFEQDTRESTNEAAQLYILAAEIMGKRPISAEPDPDGSEVPLTFSDIEDGTGTQVNRLEELELVVGESQERVNTVSLDSALEGLDSLLWFRVPPNTQQLQYWSVLDDRLYKLRNGLNLAGVARSLPLFEPPIDPALLVRAAAAGIDLSTAVSSATAPPPTVRFAVLVQRAKELTGTVRGLGSSLLQALEKRDSEQVGRMRALHETVVLRMTTSVRKEAVREAELALEGLERQRIMVRGRLEYYQGLKKRGLLQHEKDQLAKLKDARDKSEKAATQAQLSKFGGAIPLSFTWNWGGSKGKRFSTGISSQAASAAIQSITVDKTQKQANKASAQAGILGTKAGHERRKEDWAFQIKSSRRELRQIAKQIEAAKSRIESAKHNLEIHEQQHAHSKEVEQFLRTKFTNEELYRWQINQLSALYFQSYKLAHEMARRAESAYQYELASESSYIRFGYWDGLRKGLLAGEALQHDLERMEAGFLLEDTREMELRKQISLSQLDAEALLKLQEDGSCYFAIPEAIFDLDFPGHYLRRIKNVSVTIPAVVGKYGSITAKLTLHNSQYRHDATTTSSSDYPEGAPTSETVGSDSRFEYFSGAPPETVALSSGQDDSGVFQLDFNGARYVPFERRGAIGFWQLELSGSGLADVPAQFDWRSISDVVVTLAYTARDAGGGSTFTTAAAGALAGQLSALTAIQSGTGTELTAPDLDGIRLALSMATDFPDAWHRLLHPEETEANSVLSIDITEEMFPAAYRGKFDQLTNVYAAFLFADDATHSTSHDLGAAMAIAGTSVFESASLQTDPIFDETHFGAQTRGSLVLGRDDGASGSTGLDLSFDNTKGTWTLTLTNSKLEDIQGTGSGSDGNYVVEDGGGYHRLDETKVLDLVLILNYTLS